MGILTASTSVIKLRKNIEYERPLKFDKRNKRGLVRTLLQGAKLYSQVFKR
jgi:hypothetical protein